jgi:hypothetical protein
MACTVHWCDKKSPLGNYSIPAVMVHGDQYFPENRVDKTWKSGLIGIGSHWKRAVDVISV